MLSPRCGDEYVCICGVWPMVMNTRVDTGVCGICTSGLWVCGMSVRMMGAQCGLGVHVYASVHSVRLVNERLGTHVMCVCVGGDSLAGGQVKLRSTVRKH